uniref:Uncharacterized protein n=1 Tax=Parascaris univalens TaxID=6257 RepID=A0A915ACC7_PARUN
MGCGGRFGADWRQRVRRTEGRTERVGFRCVGHLVHWSFVICDATTVIELSRFQEFLCLSGRVLRNLHNIEELAKKDCEGPDGTQTRGNDLSLGQ